MSGDYARSSASRLLVFATRNPGKVREITPLLAGTGWTVGPLPENVPDYEETAETFADNARGKAISASRSVEVPVLADDSGLEIDALNGEPGVRSARYVDPSTTPAERNTAVLKKLRDVPAEQRTARFVCHLVLAHGGSVVHETTGTCEGLITQAPRGEGGFGYDPIFEVPDLGSTFAEIPGDEKSARSHRGAAARAMVDFLRSWEPDSA